YVSSGSGGSVHSITSYNLTTAATATAVSTPGRSPSQISANPANGLLYFSDYTSARGLYAANPSTGTFSQLAISGYTPTGAWSGNFVIDPTGRFLFVRDQDPSNSSMDAVWRIDLSTGGAVKFMANVADAVSGSQSQDLVFGPSTSVPGASLY